MRFQGERLAAAHIGHQATEKEDAGSLALQHVVGNGLLIRGA
jgi:hypothetical protein